MCLFLHSYNQEPGACVGNAVACSAGGIRPEHACAHAARGHGHGAARVGARHARRRRSTAAAWRHTYRRVFVFVCVFRGGMFPVHCRSWLMRGATRTGVGEEGKGTGGWEDVARMRGPPPEERAKHMHHHTHEAKHSHPGSLLTHAPPELVPLPGGKEGRGVSRLRTVKRR